MDQPQLPGDRDVNSIAQPATQVQQPQMEQPQQAPPPPAQPQYAYQPQPIYVTQQVQVAPAYVAAPQKSMALALVLTFFFGPLGLFYATLTGGVVMLIISIVVFIVTLGLGMLFVIPACMIWAAIATNNYNMSLAAPAPPTQIVR